MSKAYDILTHLKNRSTHWSRNFVSWIENEASSLPYEGGDASSHPDREPAVYPQSDFKGHTGTQKNHDATPISRFIQAFDVHSGHRVSTAATFLLEAGTSQDSQATIIWHHLWFCPRYKINRGKGYCNRGHLTKQPPSTNHVYRKRMVCDTTGSGLTLAYTKLVSRMEPNKAIIRIGRKLLNRVACVLRTRKPYVKAVVQ